MSLSTKLDILRSAPIFSQMTDDALRLLAFGAEERSYFKDQMLFRAGDVGNSAYIIIEGKAEIFQPCIQEDDQSLGFAEPGALLGELALVARNQRQFNVKAVENMSVLRIDRSLFHKLMEEYPEIANIFKQRIEANLQELLGGLDQVRSKLDAI